jgi:outer membrane murein-binding lipoprotein Lpp
VLIGAVAFAAIMLAGCTSTQQAEEAGAPSASVMCGTVITSIAALQQEYEALDAGIAAGESPTNLQPIGAEINSLTFDAVNQLQGASKESLTTVQTAAQRIVDTLVQAQGAGTTGEALAQQIADTRPEGLDAAIADLTSFAEEACAGE